MTEFLGFMIEMTRVAKTTQGDCERQEAALAAFMSENGAKLREVGRRVVESGDTGTPEDEGAVDAVLTDFGSATEACPKASLKMFELISALSPQEQLEEQTEALNEHSAPHIEAKTEPPTPAEVQVMCEAWEASAKAYGKDCSAYGKRLQRQLRDLPFKMADVPRIGEHRKALVPCKNAVKATASCADDAEVKAAHELIGEL